MEEARALRRGPDAARGRGGSRSATPRRCASRAPTARTRCCPRAPSWSPPAPSRTPCWRARTAASSSTAGISRRSTRPARRSRRCAAWPSRTSTQVLMHRAGERPLRQLLRRPAPELLRQRGEGDGRGEARLSRGVAACWPRAPATARVRRRPDRALPRRPARHRARGAPADADHRRGGDPRPRRRARLPSRPVLPACRTTKCSRRAIDEPGDRRARVLSMEGLAMTGAWTDPERGLVIGDRAGDGRQFRPVRAAEARASRWC